MKSKYFVCVKEKVKLFDSSTLSYSFEIEGLEAIKKAFDNVEEAAKYLMSLVESEVDLGDDEAESRAKRCVIKVEENLSASGQGMGTYKLPRLSTQFGTYFENYSF